MQGLGKTHLIKHFLSRIKLTGGHALYINLSSSHDALLQLTRRMLNVELEASDEIVRTKVSTLMMSSLALFYLLQILGVKLNNAEKSTLRALSMERLEVLEQAIAVILIQHCVNSSVSTVAVDNLHDAPTDCLRFIKCLASNKAHLPFFLLLSAANIKQFTFLPDWLAFAHKIELRSLDEVTTKALAKHIIKVQHDNAIDARERERIAIKRAKGHPGILEELLMQGSSVFDIPSIFQQNTLQMLRNLSTEQRTLLKRLSLIGMFLSVTLIDKLLSNMVLKGVLHLHHLVRLGFLYPVSDGYCFRHFFIREIVMKQVNNAEREQWRLFNQEINHELNQDINQNFM